MSNRGANSFRCANRATKYGFAHKASVGSTVIASNTETGHFSPREYSNIHDANTCPDIGDSHPSTFHDGVALEQSNIDPVTYGLAKPDRTADHVFFAKHHEDAICPSKFASHHWQPHHQRAFCKAIAKTNYSVSHDSCAHAFTQHIAAFRSSVAFSFSEAHAHSNCIKAVQESVTCQPFAQPSVISSVAISNIPTAHPLSVHATDTHSTEILSVKEPVIESSNAFALVKEAVHVAIDAPNEASCADNECAHLQAFSATYVKAY